MVIPAWKPRFPESPDELARRTSQDSESSEKVDNEHEQKHARDELPPHGRPSISSDAEKPVEEIHGNPLRRRWSSGSESGAIYANPQRERDERRENPKTARRNEDTSAERGNGAKRRKRDEDESNGEHGEKME
jgi:hypothetical protein